jgi:C4-dicarboxylate transporter DctQ subunit
MLEKIRSAVKAGNLFLGYLSGIGILIMGFILTYEVFVRYVLNSPTVWVQEVSIYLFMWSMLVGAAYTLMQGKHVRIDLLFDRLPHKVQLILDAITSVFGVIFCAVVTQQAYKMITSSLKYGKVSATILRVPMWLIQLPLLLGFGLLTFQFFFIIVDRLATLKAESKA